MMYNFQTKQKNVYIRHTHSSYQKSNIKISCQNMKLSALEIMNIQYFKSKWFHIYEMGLSQIKILQLKQEYTTKQFLYILDPLITYWKLQAMNTALTRHLSYEYIIKFIKVIILGWPGWSLFCPWITASQRTKCQLLYLTEEVLQYANEYKCYQPFRGLSMSFYNET